MKRCCFVKLFLSNLHDIMQGSRELQARQEKKVLEGKHPPRKITPETKRISL